MFSKSMFITERDKERVEQLMLFCDIFTEQEKKSIRKLHYDVSQGHVVSVDEIPSDVVTTNSHVVLKEVASGEEFSLTLVFPEEADPYRHLVSILTPMGASFIGRKMGETVECRTSFGIRKFTIKAICHKF